MKYLPLQKSQKYEMSLVCKCKLSDTDNTVDMSFLQGVIHLKIVIIADIKILLMLIYVFVAINLIKTLP